MHKRKMSAKNSTIMKIIISVIAGIISLIIMISFSAFLLTKNDINPEYIKYFWFPITIFSGFVSGFVAGKLIKYRGILWGSVASLVCAILLLLIILIINGSNNGYLSLILFPTTVLPGAFGGILSSNMR